MRHIRKAILIILIGFPLMGQTNFKGVSIGFNLMFGGRYDNMRMCVASPAGAKGGPVADIMFYVKVWTAENFAVGFKLPVMRPILFGAAFEMLQFEPEFTFDFNIPISDGRAFRTGFGVGGSFHYGPDYTSGREGVERTESFPAAGPFISALVGFSYLTKNDREQMIGARFFYVPLFTENRGVGTVLGGAVEYQVDFTPKK